MSSKSADAFRTISEVADWLDVPTHVLRFWESKFPQVKPVKRAGGRRYYRPTDMSLLAGIRVLLHDDGITIRGVQKILREQGVKHVAGLCDRALDGDGASVDAPAPDLVAAEDTKVVELPANAFATAEAAPDPAETAEAPLPLFASQPAPPEQEPDTVPEAELVPDPLAPTLPGPSPRRSDALGSLARDPGALSTLDPEAAQALAARLAALRDRIDGSDPA